MKKFKIIFKELNTAFWFWHELGGTLTTYNNQYILEIFTEVTA